MVIDLNVLFPGINERAERAGKCPEHYLKVLGNLLRKIQVKTELYTKNSSALSETCSETWPQRVLLRTAHTWHSFIACFMYRMIYVSHAVNIIWFYCSFACLPVQSMWRGWASKDLVVLSLFIALICVWDARCWQISEEPACAFSPCETCWKNSHTVWTTRQDLNHTIPPTDS